MTDATLGIAVTVTGAAQAATDLDKLNQSAKTTTDSVGRLHDEFGRYTTARNIPHRLTARPTKAEKK